ncbi:MAG: ATP-binding protein, partial [Planctomycetota bacterium]|nr:ATP-binding protein [Planctomycetota bacterium]
VGSGQRAEGKRGDVSLPAAYCPLPAASRWSGRGMAKAGSNSGGRGKRNGATSQGKRVAAAAGTRGSRNGAGHNHAPMTFTIRSDFSAGHDVQKRILDAVQKAGFNSQSTFAIKLALEEALINAIKHGNKLDLKKNVHIEASISPTVTEITIEDEGPGFERSSVPDPTLEENLDKCSGRGILLMEAYMTASNGAAAGGGCLW